MNNGISGRNIDGNLESGLFEKGAILDYLKKHRIDVTSYVFLALIASYANQQSSPNQSNNLEPITQYTVANQQQKVSNILQLNVTTDISNQIIQESQDAKQESIYNKDLSIDFQYDSNMQTTGLAYYDEETGQGFIKLNDAKIALTSDAYKINQDRYTEILYSNELSSIIFNHNVKKEDFQEKYPALSKRYEYRHVVEVVGEMGSFNLVKNDHSPETTRILLLRINDIIYSRGSKNQYALIADVFSNAFDKAFNDGDSCVSYTNEGVNELLKQNHFGRLPYDKITNFVTEIKGDLLSYGLDVDDFINNENEAHQIAKHTDYTNY